jgi:predicted regulator of Ras-like GTPase activity (Roadblock/LC7/MglB family)
VSYRNVMDTASRPSANPLPRRAPAASFAERELGPPPAVDPATMSQHGPALHAEFATLWNRVPGTRGCVVAGIDGLLIAHDLAPDAQPYDVATLAAAVMQIGRQSAVALHHRPFRDSTVRTDQGSFTVYALSETALLAVLGDAGLDVDRLHLQARPIVDRLADLLTGYPG